MKTKSNNLVLTVKVSYYTGETDELLFGESFRLLRCRSRKAAGISLEEDLAIQKADWREAGFDPEAEGILHTCPNSFWYIANDCELTGMFVAETSEEAFLVYFEEFGDFSRVSLSLALEESPQEVSGNVSFNPCMRTITAVIPVDRSKIAEDETFAEVVAQLRKAITVTPKKNEVDKDLLPGQIREILEGFEEDDEEVYYAVMDTVKEILAEDGSPDARQLEAAYCDSDLFSLWYRTPLSYLDKERRFKYIRGKDQRYAENMYRGYVSKQYDNPIDCSDPANPERALILIPEMVEAFSGQLSDGGYLFLKKVINYLVEYLIEEPFIFELPDDVDDDTVPPEEPSCGIWWSSELYDDPAKAERFDKIVNLAKLIPEDKREGLSEMLRRCAAGGDWKLYGYKDVKELSENFDDVAAEEGCFPFVKKMIENFGYDKRMSFLGQQAIPLAENAEDAEEVFDFYKDLLDRFGDPALTTCIPLIKMNIIEDSVGHDPDNYEEYADLLVQYTKKAVDCGGTFEVTPISLELDYIDDPEEDFWEILIEKMSAGGIDEFIPKVREALENN